MKKYCTSINLGFFFFGRGRGPGDRNGLLSDKKKIRLFISLCFLFPAFKASQFEHTGSLTVVIRWNCSVPLQGFFMCTLGSVKPLEMHASGRKVFSEGESYSLKVLKSNVVLLLSVQLIPARAPHCTRDFSQWSLFVSVWDVIEMEITELQCSWNLLANDCN